MAADACAASTAGPAAESSVVARAAIAASTACDMAHWLARAGSALNSASRAGTGTGIGQPDR